MSVFVTGMIILLCLVIVAGIWALICNETTYKDREKMLNECVVDDPNFWANIKRFNRVSYDRHFYARLFLRNPFKLYDN